MVIFPGFIVPDEDYIQDYPRLVPDIIARSSLGIEDPLGNTDYFWTVLFPRALVRIPPKLHAMVQVIFANTVKGGFIVSPR